MTNLRELQALKQSDKWDSMSSSYQGQPTKNTLTLAKADKQELWGGEGGARERQGQNGRQRLRDGKTDRKTDKKDIETQRHRDRRTDTETQ